MVSVPVHFVYINCLSMLGVSVYGICACAFCVYQLSRYARCKCVWYSCLVHFVYINCLSMIGVSVYGICACAFCVYQLSRYAQCVYGICALCIWCISAVMTQYAWCKCVW